MMDNIWKEIERTEEQTLSDMIELDELREEQKAMIMADLEEFLAVWG